MAEQVGIRAAVIHPLTRLHLWRYNGKADWNIISRQQAVAREDSCSSCNGACKPPEDALAPGEGETGCDPAVMIGLARGHYPWHFP